MRKLQSSCIHTQTPNICPSSSCAYFSCAWTYTVQLDWTTTTQRRAFPGTDNGSKLFLNPSKAHCQEHTPWLGSFNCLSLSPHHSRRFDHKLTSSTIRGGCITQSQRLLSLKPNCRRSQQQLFQILQQWPASFNASEATSWWSYLLEGVPS